MFICGRLETHHDLAMQINVGLLGKGKMDTELSHLQSVQRLERVSVSNAEIE